MMRTRKQIFRMVAGGIFLGTVLQAQAAAVLDFNIQAPTAGSISYAGGATPLVGSNLAVDNVVGIDTPAQPGVFSTCIGCVLNFTTGPNTGFTNLPPAVWSFAGGGAITITGGVDLGSDSTLDIALGTTLLTGTFNSASVTDLGGLLQLKIAGGDFLDQKDAQLLDFYDLPTGVTYSGGLNLSFSANANPITHAFFSTQVFSGDVTNSPVPIPAAVWLFGSGLLGLVGIGRLKAARSTARPAALA